MAIVPATSGRVGATYLRPDVAGGSVDDTAVIQAALSTGRDVEISDVDVKITSTLIMNKAAQRLITRNAAILPAFIGDAVLITQPHQQVSATFGSSLQPAGTTAYAEVCAIRIGGTYSSTTYNPKNASVARSRIIGAWKGNGIIWEHGAHIDFTQFSIETSATYDGIRGTNNFDDNNEGYFADTRVSNCAGYGYRFIFHTTVPEKSCREHEMINSKAFGCGTNFQFETRNSVGTIYSENGANPDQFASTSVANNISYKATNDMMNSVVDNGTGNRISGYSMYGKWDTINMLVRNMDVNGLHAGRRRLNQPADNAFEDTILDTNVNTTVTHKHGGSGTRTDIFSGLLTANNGLTVNTAALTATASLSVSGGVRYNSSTRTTSTTLLGSGAAYNLADASGGAITLTLPTTGTLNGAIFLIKKIDSTANTVTVGGTIDGATNYVLSAQWKYVRVMYSGSGSVYYLIGNN